MPPSDRTQTPPDSQRPVRWLILADDLTGAADTAAGFRARGYRTLLQLSPEAAGEEWRVVSVDLNVRERGEGEEAIQEAVRNALIGADGRRIYLKVDSTLRGPVRTLLREVLPLGKDYHVLICPAFPAQGRVTRNGVQYAHEIPVENAAPNGTQTTDLAEALGFPGLTVGDAETDGDLDDWAERALDMPDLLCVGSGGLAAALARRRQEDDPSPPLPHIERVAVVAGSANRKTHGQIDRLRDVSGTANLVVLRTPWEVRTALRAEVAGELTVQAMGLLEEPIPTGWILTGGATARAFLEKAEVSTLEIGGEILPGIPWMIARDGRIARCPVVTKAGGFGEEDVLVTITEFLLHAAERSS